LVLAWKDSPPEALSGIISRSLFWWLNDLLLSGFKSSLKLESIRPMDQSMDSEGLMTRLSSIWERRDGKEGKHTLLKATVRCLRWPFLMGGSPRLCLIGFKFSQPWLIQRVVDFVGEAEGNERRDIGYGPIGAAA
jgi:ATP-binding cassette subfamily C (CFTR/MRP) protein 1